MWGEGVGRRGAGLHTLDREAWLTGSGWSLSRLMKWGSSCPSPVGTGAGPCLARWLELSRLLLPQREPSSTESPKAPWRWAGEEMGAAPLLHTVTSVRLSVRPSVSLPGRSTQPRVLCSLRV